MADWAIRQQKYFVTLGAAGGKREAHLVEQADLSKVTHDPLLSQLRYRLRKERGAPRDGKKIGVRCVFSRENVAPPDPSCSSEGDGSLNCHGYGSVVTVTATFGLVAASLVLNFLASSLIITKK
jgi:tRNA A37 threonylcarbamoyladenosine dehydratase